MGAWDADLDGLTYGSARPSTRTRQRYAASPSPTPQPTSLSSDAMAVNDPPTDAAAQLRAATVGFNYIFSNDLEEAREVFKADDSPFHSFGIGICAFLEAALGMEVRPITRRFACLHLHSHRRLQAGLMAEAARLLTVAETATKKQLKLAKTSSQATQFPPGTEWELLHSDAVILLGLTHALRFGPAHSFGPILV